jgi:hypothetical protein
MAAPSTYRQNTTNTPIDGIWTSRGLEIITGGYFGMDEVIPSTDHRCLWIDISQSIAFGQGGMPPIIKPAARRLNTRNPNICDNFISSRKKYAENSALLQRIIHLEISIQGELSQEQIKEYETIDNIRRRHLHMSEKKCRKIRKGNVPYSDTLQMSRNKIEGWSLLLKFKKGLKISSRKLSRTLKKADIPNTYKRATIIEVQDERKCATKDYYKKKKFQTTSREPPRKTGICHGSERTHLKRKYHKTSMLTRITKGNSVQN